MALCIDYKHYYDAVHSIIWFKMLRALHYVYSFYFNSDHMLNNIFGQYGIVLIPFEIIINVHIIRHYHIYFTHFRHIGFA